MHMSVRKTHCMTLRSVNTEVPCSHSNNINHHNYHTGPLRWYPKNSEFSLLLHFRMCSEICEVQTTSHQTMSLKHAARCPPHPMHLPQGWKYKSWGWIDKAISLHWGRSVAKFRSNATWKFTPLFKVMQQFTVYPFKHQVKSHLPFAGIIRSSPYTPR